MDYFTHNTPPEQRSRQERDSKRPRELPVFFTQSQKIAAELELARHPDVLRLMAEGGVR